MGKPLESEEEQKSMEYTSIPIPKPLAEEIDRFIAQTQRKMAFRSRTEFVVSIIRSYMQNYRDP